MSRIHDAKQAIADELAHARQGLAYYTNRVAALEKALAEIAGIDALGSPAAKKAQRAVQQTTPATRSKSKPAKAKSGLKLPKMGNAFWLNLITGQPASTKQIFDKAVASTGMKLGPAEEKKLHGRMTVALSTLVKTGEVKDSGKGKTRQFFKDNGAA